MEIAQSGEATPRKPLRVWPAVVIVALQWLLRFVVPIFYPESLFVGVIAGFAGGLLIILWWLFFSRAPWLERFGALVLVALAVFVTSRLIHISIAKGAMGMLFPLLLTPVLSLAFVVGALITRRFTTGPRLATLMVFVVLACGAFILIRTAGVTGDFDNQLAWRWSETPEERLLAKSKDEPKAVPPSQPAAPAPPSAATQETQPSAPAVETTKQESEALAGDEAVPSEPAPAKVDTAEWPGFRGPKRDGIVHGVQIETDWSASPPKRLWQRPVGPGWSSFAVNGDLFYTQEQRGEDEVVACYKVSTGEPVWMHKDAARFWESNAGAGPRGTPTLNNGRVYAFGATGILNALDANTGAVVWSRNPATDTQEKTPGWGFSSSPLVVDDVVIVAASGRLAAYDINTGNPRWYGPKGGMDYSSPHLLTIDGVPQVLLLANPGAASLAPTDGKVLWEHKLPTGTRIVQPAVTGESDLLLTDGDNKGLRRVTVDHGPNGWKVQERWTSNGLKLYFSDFVVHKGHAFGFDGNYLTCIDLQDGKRKWKGGKYGQGQLVLLADQDVLLLVSEKGELALVSAAPDQFTELAKLPGIEGKTWNHPALTHDVLLVRNDEQMAAFRLTKKN